MIDPAADRAIKNDTEELVGRIARKWPDQHLSIINDDMQYGQYAEAVLDIVAVCYKEKISLSAEEISKIRDLIHKMKIGGDVKQLMERLTKHDSRSFADEVEPIAAFLSR